MPFPHLLPLPLVPNLPHSPGRSCSTLLFSDFGIFLSNLTVRKNCIFDANHIENTRIPRSDVFLMDESSL
jgi:hypothetical protein